MIEGNRLTQEQVAQVIGKHEHFPGRERDEQEVLGYYAALAKAEQLAAGTIIVTEKHVQTLHALVMTGGSRRGVDSVAIYGN
jgi:Fic family protein